MISLHSSRANVTKECLQEYFESKNLTKRLKPSKINFAFALLDDDCSTSIDSTLRTMAQMIQSDMTSKHSPSQTINCTLKEFKSVESKDLLLSALLHEIKAVEPEVFVTIGKKSRITSLRQRSSIEEFVENIKQECDFKLQGCEILRKLHEDGLKSMTFDDNLEMCIIKYLKDHQLVDDEKCLKADDSNISNSTSCGVDILSMKLSFKALIGKLNFTQCFSNVFCNDNECRLFDKIFLIHFTRNESCKDDNVTESYQKFVSDSVKLLKRCRLDVIANSS